MDMKTLDKAIAIKKQIENLTNQRDRAYGQLAQTVDVSCSVDLASSIKNEVSQILVKIYNCRLDDLRQQLKEL